MNRIARLLPVPAAVALLLGGCAAKDSDEDLLSDDFELAIGTNPDIADSDGDGFDDATEYLQYFNPMDETDAPYEGGYARLPARHNHPDGEDFDSSGWGVGDLSHDWSLVDQFGDQLDLHDFYGQVILIDMGAEWCGPCRNAAPEAQSEYEDKLERGFVILNLLLDGQTQTSPPDVDRWIDDFDLTFPVLADHEMEVATHYIESEGGSFSIPNFSVIDRNLEIVEVYSVGGVDYGAIDDLLDEQAPEVEWPLPENTTDVRDELGIHLAQADDAWLDDNIALGTDLAGAGASTSGGGDTSGGGGYSGGGVVTPANADGTYGGPPFGGAACSAGAGAPSGLLSLLAGLFGLVALRRRA